MTNKNQTNHFKFCFFGYILTFALGILNIGQSFAASCEHSATNENIITYYESGQYRKEITSIVQQAKSYLRQRIAQNHGTKVQQKLAIVLDIDETALSNFNFYRENVFCTNQEQFWQHVRASNNPAITPILNLFRFAKRYHVAVFFITSRPEKFRIFTENNLTNAGYYHWDVLYMRPNTIKADQKALFKPSVRQKITDMGYTIVLNIGDSDQDLIGGNAEKVYKVPNPFY